MDSSTGSYNNLGNLKINNLITTLNTQIYVENPYYFMLLSDWVNVLCCTPRHSAKYLQDIY